MRSKLFVTLVLAGSVVARSSGQVPPGQPPGQGRSGPPRNLQVLPKEWTGQQVMQLMRTFTSGLGVTCDHCHVSQQDRASDDKKPKLVARKMIAMLLAINGDFMKDIGEPPAAPPPPPPAGAPAGAAAAPAHQVFPPLPPLKVTCYTCHRGALKPLTVPGAPGGAH